MMAAEGDSHTNHPLDPSSVISFVPPDWFVVCNYQLREPGKRCDNHDICELVESDLLLLKEVEKEEEMGMVPNLDSLKEKLRDASAEEFYKHNREKMKILTEERKLELTPELVAWKQKMEGVDKALDEAIYLEDKTWLIKEGDQHNVEQLLCPTMTKRDFLIRRTKTDTGTAPYTKVNISQLSKKHVVIYFSCLTPGGDVLLYHEDLEEVYNDLFPQEKFEVVFVVLSNVDEESFDAAFSKMPWLAIPFEDQEARQLLQQKFSIPQNSQARAVLFGPDGRVLDIASDVIFTIYGTEGFPFTSEKLKVDIENDDDALLNKLFLGTLSLAELLGNTVTTFEGKEVPTSQLEGKTVGLYFYEDSDSGIERTELLEEIWNSVKDKGFEIVINHALTVNHASAMIEFKNKFGHIPWYSLSKNGRKLRRVLRVDVVDRYDVSYEAGYLIILEPNGPPRSLNYFAFDIYDTFGIDAYPFTLKSAVMLRRSKLEKTLVLDKLLSPSAPLCRGCSSCSGYSSCSRCSAHNTKDDIVVSNLLGKCVLLLFATHSCYGSGKFLRELKKIYLEMQRTDDSFEIIYISLDCDQSLSSFPNCIHEMPWLVHSFVPDFADSLVEKVFEFEEHVHIPAIAAFGPTGHLVAKESNLAFKTEWSPKYPVIKPYICEAEVRQELIRHYKWDLDLAFPGISTN